jgi:hypothetical protein
MSITPIRSIRIPEKLWLEARAKAKAENDTVSRIIVKLLSDWVTRKP